MTLRELHIEYAPVEIDVQVGAAFIGAGGFHEMHRCRPGFFDGDVHCNYVIEFGETFKGIDIFGFGRSSFRVHAESRPNRGCFCRALESLPLLPSVFGAHPIRPKSCRISGRDTSGSAPKRPLK